MIKIIIRHQHNHGRQGVEIWREYSDDLHSKDPAIQEMIEAVLPKKDPIPF